MKLDLRSLLHRKPEPEPLATEQSGRWASILARIDHEAYPDSVLALNVQVVCALASLARSEADFLHLKHKAIALAHSIRDAHDRSLADQQIEALACRHAPETRPEPEFRTSLVSRAAIRSTATPERSLRVH
jgi:hypothetical protein